IWDGCGGGSFKNWWWASKRWDQQRDESHLRPTYGATTLYGRNRTYESAPQMTWQLDLKRFHHCAEPILV
ncbi:MAG TPA: hypothetical protein VGH55_06710, partial [Chthoniobacterales bacterium]